MNLSKQSLTSLPESIGELSELKILSLVDNELTSLPKFLFKLTKLEQLSLNNNPIQYGSTDVQALKVNLQNLTHLWIGGKNHLKKEQKGEGGREKVEDRDRKRGLIYVCKKCGTAFELVQICPECAAPIHFEFF